jgi:hypothetical protein
VSRAASFLLSIGKDYEDASEMRKSMIETRFTGCSGPISFSKDSNNRDLASFDIYNYQLVDEKYSTVTAGVYTPLGTT